MKHSQVVNDNNNVKILFLDSDSNVVRTQAGAGARVSRAWVHPLHTQWHNDNIPAFYSREGRDSMIIKKHCYTWLGGDKVKAQAMAFGLVLSILRMWDFEFLVI